MKNLIFLSFILIAFSCKHEPSGNSSNAPHPAEESTPTETEYGLPGSDKTSVSKSPESSVFKYQQYVVKTTPAKDSAGEDIAVSDATGQEIWLLDNGSSANSFYGISYDHVFVDMGTGPDGRKLLVFNLLNKKTVLEAGYIGDLSISSEGLLSYYLPVTEKQAGKVDCPEKASWEKQGLAVGYGQAHELLLTGGQPVAKPVFKCFLLQ